MIACLDVHYFDDHAHAAAIVCRDWTSAEPHAEYAATEPRPADYRPGRFHLRELNPLLAVVAEIDEAIDAYVIDGYCHLSSDLAPGLGAFLHDALGSDASVVGVAKSRYRDTSHAFELLRANSRRSLFVTAIGMSYETAARHVASMAGDFRIPALLKAADRLARPRAERHAPGTRRAESPADSARGLASTG